MKDRHSNSTSKHDSGRERRIDTRHDATAVPQLSARLVGGPAVRLINISKRGALFETNTRLLPGQSISVRFIAADAELTLTGRVVRSNVGTLTGTRLKYHTALCFGEDNTLCERLVEEGPSTSSASPDEPAARATDTVTEPEPSLTLVTSVSHSASELKDLLAVNDW
jgi:hypothetical protein